MLVQARVSRERARSRSGGGGVRLRRARRTGGLQVRLAHGAGGHSDDVGECGAPFRRGRGIAYRVPRARRYHSSDRRGHPAHDAGRGILQSHHHRLQWAGPHESFLLRRCADSAGSDCGGAAGSPGGVSNAPRLLGGRPVGNRWRRQPRSGAAESESWRGVRAGIGPGGSDRHRGGFSRPAPSGDRNSFRLLAARRATLLKLYTTEFAAIGLLSGLIGGVLAQGFTAAALAVVFHRAGAAVEWKSLAAAIVAGVLLSVAAGWLPTFGLLKRRPLEALRCD